jgi:hypothetical protein
LTLVTHFITQVVGEQRRMIEAHMASFTAPLTALAAARGLNITAPVQVRLLVFRPRHAAAVRVARPQPAPFWCKAAPGGWRICLGGVPFHGH